MLRERDVYVSDSISVTFKIIEARREQNYAFWKVVSVNQYHLYPVLFRGKS
jgi:hypothetical protein